jgi:hypothetical protein
MDSVQSKTVFLSYASPDRDRVIPIYDFLLDNDFTPWIDAKQLLPGQNWEFEVNKALDSALLIIIFVSENSVNRTGYVQKELRIALSKLQEHPIHHIYVIPVILDRNASIPPQLSGLQYIYFDTPDFHSRLLDALKYQLHQVGIAQDTVRIESEIEWHFERFQESWNGLPGYEIDISWPTYFSKKYLHISHASDIIKGDLFLEAGTWRESKLDQMPDIFSMSQNEFTRTNFFHSECKDPALRGSVLSQHINTHWYGAGAAHPNTHIRTWAFFLDPLVPISSLESCFLNSADTLSRLQSLVRQQLNSNLRGNTSDVDKGLPEDDWIVQGTTKWADFRAFTFEKQGLAISFNPYQVASYANGSQYTLIPYEHIAPLLRKYFRDALLL